MTWSGRMRHGWRRLVQESSSPTQLAAAVFLGVLVGVSPFYGLQMLLVVVLATVLRLNRLAALSAVQISIPPIYPFLVLASLQTGSLLLRGDWLEFTFDDVPETGTEVWLLLQELWGIWLLGSLAVGAVLGALCGALVLLLALGRPEEEKEAEDEALRTSRE